MTPSIVICSSFRFYADVLKLQRALEEAGYRTEIPVPNEWLDPQNPWNLKEGVRREDPEVFEAHWRNITDHLGRIERTDIVYVYGGGRGYVGRGVSSEMGFARGIRRYNPLQKPRTVLSSEEIADMGMRGYVEEVVTPAELARRLSSRG